MSYYGRVGSLESLDGEVLRRDGERKTRTFSVGTLYAETTQDEQWRHNPTRTLHKQY